MVNSDLHEVAAVIIRDLLRGAMDKQDALNPPLINAWQLHTNRSAWFNDRQGNHYISDMTLFFMPPLRPTPLLHLEVVFTQDWNVLRRKLDRMLLNPNAWGVLVLKISEASRLKPGQPAKHANFISVDDFDEETHRAQNTDEYGALWVNGFEWMGRVTCEVYFFPSDWEVGFADPQAVSRSCLQTFIAPQILPSIR